MKKFLGMPLWREPLTDWQYVDRVRKGLHTGHKYGPWLFLLYSALAVAFVWVLVNSVKWAANAFPALPQNLRVAGFILGFLFGLPLSAVAWHLGHGLAQAIVLWRGDRRSRLLVKYHDMLRELARSDQPVAAPESGGEGRAGQGRAGEGEV